jgi:alpha-beta hydrolase superfamily lysophospholipase
LLDSLDPSVGDELNPDDRDAELDLYDPTNPARPPYAQAFLTRYREAQIGRMRKITVWVKQTLDELKRRNDGEVERGFITHRTMADPRYLDPAVDPNDRRPEWSYLGNPKTVNNGPVGMARFSTLRSWLSQWSIDDSRADGITCAADLIVPLLAIENSADDAVPQPHTGWIYEAAKSPDKTFKVIEGGTHYYAGQPEHLKEATELVRDWLRTRNFIDA